MSHDTYMKRCLALALTGHGSVSPNPMVGAVVVRDNQIVGEGAHLEFGKSHAEVHALNSITGEPRLTNASLYVNLEPCSHYGNTPPCTDSILNADIRHVVVAMQDPDSRVSGRGIEILKSKGVTVETNILQNEAQFLNRRFLTHRTSLRPYIILKWAETADGYIARPDGSSKWISNEQSRKMVHQWRGEEDAILVGTNTAVTDNPQLTARIAGKEVHQPLRIFLDRQLRVPRTHVLYDGSCRTICFTESKAPSTETVTFYEVSFSDQFWKQVFAILYKHNITSIIIEGGAHVLNGLIAEELWDEARVFTAKTKFSDGIAAPILKQNAEHIMPIGEDELHIYMRNKKFFKDFWV